MSRGRWNLVGLAALAVLMGGWATPARVEISLAEVRAIAKEAYIYGFPTGG